jgi:hypothetical protein
MSDICNYEHLQTHIIERVDPNKVKVNLFADKEIPPMNFVVCGAFNPYFETESVGVPIEIDIYVNTIKTNIDMYEATEILDEFSLVLRHELIHLEQYTEDRFDFEDIEANEKEAYAREKKEVPWYRNIKL